MKNIFKLLALVTCAALLLSKPTRVCAQAKETPPASTAATGGTNAFVPATNRIKEFHVDGLPLAEVVKNLQEQFPDVNFLMTPEVRDFAEPIVLQLRSVTLQEILTAIQLTTRGALQINPLFNEKMVSLSLDPNVIMEGKLPKPQKICRAFSLSNYLSNRSPDQTSAALKEVEDALAQCWSMLSKANSKANKDNKFERPELSLHPETKLLIVVGEPEQLEVVAQVVNEIERGVQKKSPAQQMLDDARRELNESRNNRPRSPIAPAPHPAIPQRKLNLPPPAQPFSPSPNPVPPSK